MAKKAKTGLFPGDLFVTREEDTDGSNYFIANKTTDGLDDGVDVAIYQLVEVKRMKVTRELK